MITLMPKTAGGVSLNLFPAEDDACIYTNNSLYVCGDIEFFISSGIKSFIQSIRR